MKKVIAIVVSVLFVLSVAGLSFAAEQKAAPAAPAEKKEMAPAKADEKAPVKMKRIAGEVSAVDAKAKTLTVKGEKGDTAFSVDEKSTVKLADIKVGDKVTVMYREADGKNVALRVVAKKAAEKMEKKEAAPAAPKAEEKKPAAPAEKKKAPGY